MRKELIIYEEDSEELEESIPEGFSAVDHKLLDIKRAIDEENFQKLDKSESSNDSQEEETDLETAAVMANRMSEIGVQREKASKAQKKQADKMLSRQKN